AIGGAFALGGVVLGAVLASFFELYRRVLDGQAAASLVKYEMWWNRAQVKELLADSAYESELSDEAWKAHALAVAPLLADADASDLVIFYTTVRHAQSRVNESKAKGYVAEKDVEWLRGWREQTLLRSHALTDIARSSRLALIWHLVGQPRKPTSLTQAAPKLEAARRELERLEQQAAADAAKKRNE
ncbi:hypothetical protein LCGC14_2311370, partial [marine sediment metagenome]